MMKDGDGGGLTTPPVRSAGVAVSAAVLLLAALFPVFQTLEIGSGDGRVLLSVSEGDVFTHGYTHSMYGAPVSEKFRIEDGSLRLFHVMTESEAVLEYFAIEKKGAPNTAGKFKSFSIPGASIGRHVLDLNGREIAIERRDAGTILVTVKKISFMTYLKTHLWR